MLAQRLGRITLVEDNGQQHHRRIPYQMKTCVVLVICFLGAAAWAQVVPGQPSENGPRAVPTGPVVAAANTSLSFEAKAISSGGPTKTQHGNSDLVPSIGSVTVASAKTVQTHQSVIRLEVRVRNYGTVPAQAHLDCYFVAAALPHGRRYIWNEVARDVAVPARGELPEEVQSTALTQFTEQQFQRSVDTKPFNDGSPTISETASRKTTGAKPSGWIVRLMSGDRLLKVQASSSELEVIGRDANALTILKNVRPTGR